MTGYVLEERLGAGGMSVVYRAHRTDGSRVVVAYKHPASTAAPDHLRNEAAVLRTLHHPNIVRLLDVVDEGATVGLALQYAAGGSVADRLASGQVFTPLEAAGVLSSIADALAVVHEQGLVHGDVKPSNILFTATGLPLLSDFGAAGPAGPVTDLPAATAEYLDPASSGARTAESDVYALAVVGVEMLTGRRPDGGASLADGALGQVLARALAERPHREYTTAAAFAAGVRETARHLAPVTTRAPAVTTVARRTEPPTRPFGVAPPAPPAASPVVVPWRRVAAVAALLAVLPPATVLAVQHVSRPDATVPASPALP